MIWLVTETVLLLCCVVVSETLSYASSFAVHHR